MKLDRAGAVPATDDERLQLLIDAVSDYAIYMLDPDGFVASWNSGAQKIKGYRTGEILGQHFARFFTAEDQGSGLPLRILDEGRRRGGFEAEGWRVRKDGSRFWANSVINAIRASDGQLIGFASITRDITERVQAQEALLESERRFRLLVENVVDYAICMLDPSGIITKWNAGAQRLKGYSADEVLGQHFSIFYTKEDRTAGLPIRVLDTALREGRYECEGWRLRKDGSRFWASVVIDSIRTESGALLGFGKITRDITERRAAQDALRDSERQLRLMIEGVTDYALFMLDPNGVIVSWNAGAQRARGYTADEIIGQHFSRFYTEADRAAGVPARALYTAAEQGRIEMDGWRVRKDGSLFWANVVIDAIKDEAGKLIGFAKITRDVTERREAQVALRAAETQRAHAQKMEALGQLTGGVAHDFNNLLMIISGHLQTLKKLAAQDPKATRAAETIELACRRAETLTRQLLTFSRRQTLNPQVVDVGQRIREIEAMLASSVGGAARLVVEVAPNIWPVHIDVNEFELALVNVAINARDAMPQGGVIGIHAENATLSQSDTPADIEGDYVSVTVSDTGCGIADDILPKVFDPFFTTKQADKGTGLGLSQVHGFAHQSGGTVTIKSRLGVGTSITLFLPRAHATPIASSEPAVVESSAGGTVLLVEDNPDVATVSASLLQQLAYVVHSAVDASKALELLEQYKFDLVISDIVMAGEMDGVELARTIRRLHPKLPIILVTGYSNAAATVDAEFPVLRKPYQLADLNRAANKAIFETREPRPSNLVNLRDAKRHR